jgi:hypothetical protein
MVNEATRRVGWEPVIDVAVMRFVGAHLLLNWEPCSGVACSYAGRVHLHWGSNGPSEWTLHG